MRGVFRRQPCRVRSRRFRWVATLYVPPPSPVYPDPGDVALGVQYGPTGADYTGTLETEAAPGADVYFRHVARDLVAIVAGSGPTDRWTVVDRQSPPQPVDLSGKTVRLVVALAESIDRNDRYLDVYALPALYESGGDRLTVGGEDNNVVTVRHDPDDTGTPGLHLYWLLNVTDRVVLARGEMPVLPIAAGAWD
jgi:hypothetical protein